MQRERVTRRSRLGGAAAALSSGCRAPLGKEKPEAKPDRAQRAAGVRAGEVSDRARPVTLPRVEAEGLRPRG